MSLELLVLLVNLLVWGGHAVLPWRCATGSERLRRAWRLAAVPALGSSVVATLALLSLRPDPAVAWNLGLDWSGSFWARVIVVAVAAAALADVLTLFGAERLGRLEWRVAGALGVIALAAVTLGSELLRIGWGPVPTQRALFAAAALRLPLGLAVGEVLAGPPRLWTPVAAPALVAAWMLWPAALRAALDPDRPTLFAGAVLLLAARFLPPTLRRWAAVAGICLAALWLAQAGLASAQLGTGVSLPIELLGP